MSGSRRQPRTDAGFSIVELAIVVFIIGVLVAVAMPVFWANVATVKKKTCFANQRTIDAAVSTWSATNASPVTALQGVVDGDHPLITAALIRAPHCPSAPAPADYDNPDSSTGAYSLDASGNLAPCPWGSFGPHGTY